MTYFNSTSVRATCACARVSRPCNCFARFVSVAAMRASNCVTESALSLLRISPSQAAWMNACSDRKPLSIDVFLTRSRNSLLGNSKFRSVLGFAIQFPPFFCGGTFVPHRLQKLPHSFLVKSKHLPVKMRAASPQPFMFQYLCRSPMIRPHFMYVVPTAVEEC